MKAIFRLLQTVSYWGVKDDMPEYKQRSLILTNQLLLIGSFVTIVIFSMMSLLGLLVNALFLLSMLLITGFGLWANKEGKSGLSQFLFSTGGVILTVMSVVTKLRGETNALIFVFPPRLALILLSIFMLLISSYQAIWRRALLILPSSICLVFFEEIHQLFGIQVYTLPVGEPVLVFKLAFSMIFLALCFAFLSIQKVNVIFQNRINVLLKQSGEKNEELARQNDVIKEKSEELTLQNELISKKNKQITDSILYAQRIQQAIMSTPKQIESHFPESFVFFRPKDIVSGDFFWFDEVQITENQDSKRIYILAVGDCTGHGVPGALMTMLGVNFLEEIVMDRKIRNPEQILRELDKKVIATTQKQGKNVNDGMDITLLCIDPAKKEIQFAGAKNPLYYVRQEAEKAVLHTIKGSRFPIGSSQFKEEKSIWRRKQAKIHGQIFPRIPIFDQPIASK
jgi:Stage II sporulation protein E (SpoIIE)